MMYCIYFAVASVPRCIVLYPDVIRAQILDLQNTRSLDFYTHSFKNKVYRLYLLTFNHKPNISALLVLASFTDGHEFGFFLFLVNEIQY